MSIICGKRNIDKTTTRFRLKYLYSDISFSVFTDSHHKRERVGRTMDTMSDGECQRIMIARALAQDTPIMMLDEPTSFLDMPNRYELVSLLRILSHEKGKCILFSTHELDVALRMCDSIALVDDGALHHLPVTDMVESGHIQRLFSIQDIK